VLVADVAGYSRLIGAYEERTLDRLGAIRSDLIEPTKQAIMRRRAVSSGARSSWTHSSPEQWPRWRSLI
jgi:hypothetical protein